jgi:recombination protein RecT
MSNEERKANLPAIIKTAEATFTQLARRHQVPDFTFEREAAFAVQILKDSKFLGEVAVGNPDSLKAAIINVAAIGLSLSPVHNFAYLVPRKVGKVFKVCLDISYKGYIELSTSKGVMVWVKAEVVRDADEFEYHGVNKEPLHKFHPFKDRGNIIGGYVVAKMTTGDLLVDFMPIVEIHAIRDRSEGWKAFKRGDIHSSPWKTDEAEMIKKTLIRRGRKSWPSSVAREIDAAVDVTNEDDKIDFEAEQLGEPAGPTPHQIEGFAIIREFLEALDRTEEVFVEHLSRTTNRKIEKIEDLTPLEVDQSVTFLEGVVKAQQAKLEKLKAKEKRNENVG